MKYSKLLLKAFAAAAILVGGNVQAQDVKGKNFVNVGIGVGTFGFIGTGGLPITASYEHGFTDKISAGAAVAFVQKTYMNNWKYSYTVVGARGSYHFNELLKVEHDKLDVYGGVSLFYRNFKVKYKGNGESGTLKESGGDVDFALHAGARYKLTQNLSGYAELGYGISPLQLGVSFQF